MELKKIDLHDRLFNKMKSNGVNFKRMHQSDLDIIIQVINQEEAVIWIHDFANLVPYYINHTGKEYYGFDSNYFDKIGFEIYAEIAHPEDFGATHKLIAFFNDDPKRTCRSVVRVKHNSGKYIDGFMPLIKH